jgi:hypothetical protein
MFPRLHGNATLVVTWRGRSLILPPTNGTETPACSHRVFQIVTSRPLMSAARNQLTPWSRDILKKLILAQMVQTHSLLWNLKFHYRVHKVQSLVLVLEGEELFVPAHPTPGLKGQDKSVSFILFCFSFYFYSLPVLINFQQRRYMLFG